MRTLCLNQAIGVSKRNMPCACKVPAETYPENAEWGPLFWKLLHGLAELAGRQTDTVLQGDEVRTWIQILTQMKPCIPCDVCREHYGRWLADHPVDGLLKMPYKDTRLWIQTYIFNLHNEINEGNDKPIFAFSDLAETYKGVNITATWRALEPVMKKAISLNGISLLPWKKWIGFIRVLQGIYG